MKKENNGISLISLIITIIVIIILAAIVIFTGLFFSVFTIPILESLAKTVSELGANVDINTSLTPISYKSFLDWFKLFDKINDLNILPEGVYGFLFVYFC